MATNLISPLHLRLHPKPLLSFTPPPLMRSDASPAALRSARRWRGEAVVVRAGPPSTNTLILAFVLPLSLLVGTVLTSIRIAEDLDEQYLEELAMNEALREEMEAADDGDGDVANTDGEGIIPPPEEEVVTVPRARNRPRREA